MKEGKEGALRGMEGGWRRRGSVKGRGRNGREIGENWE